MLFSDRLEVWSPGELRPPMTLDKLTRPHPSLPVNPLIAEPLYLSKYIEKAGSGTLDMADLCRSAGLRPPEFRLDVGCFIVTIYRKQRDEPESKAQVTEQVKRLLLMLGDETLTGKEVMLKLGLSHRPTFLYTYLHPALKNALIEMTIPDKPNSRLQKYRLTAKGETLLAGS